MGGRYPMISLFLERKRVWKHVLQPNVDGFFPQPIACPTSLERKVPIFNQLIYTQNRSILVLANPPAVPLMQRENMRFLLPWQALHPRPKGGQTKLHCGHGQNNMRLATRGPKRLCKRAVGGRNGYETDGKTKPYEKSACHVVRCLFFCLLCWEWFYFLDVTIM